MSDARRDVVAMGHFCEKHGPSVIFVTEQSELGNVTQLLARQAANALTNAESAAPSSTSSCAMCRSFADGASP